MKESVSQWFKANDLRQITCSAILWQNDVVLDTTTWHNCGQLAPFLRNAVQRGATRLELIDDHEKIFKMASGDDILAEEMNAEQVLAYHMVKRGLDEAACLKWLEED